MNLDKLQFKATVRSGWQALDLGFLMAGEWWRPLFIFGALPSLILFIPLFIFFYDSPVWAGFIIWWLKPFWERLPLYYASRRIFAEDSTAGEIFSLTGSLYKKDVIPWLLWRRFSFQRAFDAPVTVLEELKWKSRSRRLHVLHGKYSDVALSNQFICACFEWIFSLGIVTLIIFFIPDDFGLELYDTVDELNLAGQRLYILCWFIAMTLVMPFHTMAGFALYLNRRIELEAWDIEITFRNLARRKQQAAENAASLLASLLVAIVLLVAAPSNSYAGLNHDAASANQLVDDVLKGRDFGQEKTIRKWRFKNLIEENEDKIPEWLINFIEWWEKNVNFSGSEGTPGDFAGWFKAVLIGLAIVLVIYLLVRFRGPAGRLNRGQNTVSAPEVMFGLDIRPDSLPNDVPAQVMSIWQDGHQRDAMGLLYRASLSRLIEKYAVAFKSSHTESECVALVRAQSIDTLSHYFAKLTGVWCHLAYGHESPAKQMMQQLCDEWTQVMSDAI